MRTITLALLQSASIAGLADPFPDAIGGRVGRCCSLGRGHLVDRRVTGGRGHGMRVVGDSAVVEGLELCAVRHEAVVDVCACCVGDGALLGQGYGIRGLEPRGQAVVCW